MYRVTDGKRTFLKWSVLTCFLTKKQFYYREIFVIACHLNYILWMKDYVRQVVSTFLNADFKPLLKFGVYTFQHLTINCLPLPPWLPPSDRTRCKVCEYRHVIWGIPTKKVTSGQIRGPWGPWDVAKTWNDPSWKHAMNHVHWQSCSVWGGTILLKINILHVV